jgi:type I restriction-modification system DNA methylase subunit
VGRNHALGSRLAATRQDQTVYDPTCGSGSLLLKAAAEAPRGITIYGQEKDNATWALSKMNMILHGSEDADIQKGDTLTSPQFTRGGQQGGPRLSTGPSVHEGQKGGDARTSSSVGCRRGT